MSIIIYKAQGNDFKVLFSPTNTKKNKTKTIILQWYKNRKVKKKRIKSSLIRSWNWIVLALLDLPDVLLRHDDFETSEDRSVKSSDVDPSVLQSNQWTESYTEKPERVTKHRVHVQVSELSGLRTQSWSSPQQRLRLNQAPGSHGTVKWQLRHSQPELQHRPGAAPPRGGLQRTYRNNRTRPLPPSYILDTDRQLNFQVSTHVNVVVSSQLCAKTSKQIGGKEPPFLRKCDQMSHF